MGETFNQKSPEKIKSPEKKKISPFKTNSSKKKESPNKNDSPRSKKGQLLMNKFNDFHEARQIQSFILDDDEDEEVEVSFVEKQGEEVLNWNICKGKAS